MKLPLYQIDAFTSRLFGGNPAAVVLLEAWLPDAVLGAIAAENNLAETAFVIPRDDVSPRRWFTPAVEVDLCGHATLASARRALPLPLSAARPPRVHTQRQACRRTQGWAARDGFSGAARQARRRDGCDRGGARRAASRGATRARLRSARDACCIAMPAALRP
jgi:hypothetical protein